MYARWTKRRQQKQRKIAKRRSKRVASLESLERRLMMTGLPLVSAPRLVCNIELDVTAEPVTIYEEGGRSQRRWHLGITRLQRCHSDIQPD